MFTLFFAGKILAPKLMVSDNGEMVNIQDFLQNHYFEAIKMIVKAINEEGGLEDSCVVVYDTLNEPHHGWIGVEDITRYFKL